MRPYARGWKHHATNRTTWQESVIDKVVLPVQAPEVTHQECKIPGIHQDFFWFNSRTRTKMCHICNWEIAFGDGETPHIRYYPKKLRKRIVEALERDRYIHIHYDPSEDNDPV